MAGQGWREWVAGEQLTDAKMQNFLQDQSVMRFSNASARDSALTGVLSEGMIAYLDDLNVVEVYDGSEWTELTGDPDIFTQGTAGQYLASLGTAGVEWSDIEGATTSAEGLVYGFTAGTTSARFNVALGFGAAPSTTALSSFIGNVGVGVGTLASLTTGHNNVGFGSQTGISLTSGSKNTFIGSDAGNNLTTNDSNTFIGFAAGTFAEGGGHVAIGSEALTDVEISSGGASVAIGNQAMKDTTGDANVAIGSGAGSGITSGVNNTAIGFSAGNSFFANDIGTGTNNTLLGSGTSPSATNVSNQITLGNASISSLRCQVTSISALSDIRDKTNVQDSTYGLELIKQLRPVTFDWNMRDGAKVGVPDVGFIAQELAAVEDNYDAERLALTLRDNPDKLEATPGRLIPILVKAIQELTAEVEALKNAR